MRKGGRIPEAGNLALARNNLHPVAISGAKQYSAGPDESHEKEGEGWCCRIRRHDRNGDRDAT